MWPSENPWPLIIALLIAIVGLLIVWYQQRRMQLLAVAGLFLVLAVAAWGYDAAVETEREKVIDNVYGVTRAFQERRMEDTYNYVSDSARDVRLLFGTAFNVVQVQDDMRVTDVSAEILAQETRAKSRFRVNATVQYAGMNDRVATLWEVKWQREPAGWKMIDVTEFHPVTGERLERIDQLRGWVRQMYPPPPATSVP